MVVREQYGFTLVEVTIVMALSALMVVFVISGQANLRDQAQFDANVDKVVATVSYAQGEALSGTNISGAGNGTGACSAAALGQTYFAGTVIEFNNALPGSPVELKYYKANPGNGGVGLAACVFQSQSITIPYADFSVLSTAPTFQGLVYVRTPTGGMTVCYVTNAADTSPQVVQSFEDGACAGGASSITSAGTIQATFTDSSNHKSSIQIDGSGLAKRVS